MNIYMYMQKTILEVPLSNIQNSLFTLRPDQKNKCVSGNGSEILGRVGTHIFFLIFFSGKNIILCILKGISPFKMH